MSKTLKILLSISWIAFTLASCVPADTTNYVLLSGKIANTDGSFVTVKGEGYSYDVDLNADGTFSDTLTLERGFYTFYSKRERTSIFLDQGFDLNLEIDQTQFDETLTFTGEGQGTAINNYLASKVRLEEKLNVDFQTLFSKNEADFVAAMTTTKKELENLLKNSQITDAAFVSLEEKNLAYDYMGQFTNYEYYHQYAAKEPDFEVSEGFEQNIGQIDVNNEEDFKTLASYKSLLQSYFGSMIERGQIEKAFDIIQTITSAEIKAGILPAFTYKVEPGNAAAEEIYKGIMSVSTDSTLVAKLTDKIEKIRKLQEGMPSPAFAYQSIGGPTVSLADLQGKYIYVDVWATWCGPCLREIPALKQLEADFHDQPIEFVSISIDVQKDFEKWQQMVSDKSLEGVQLFADKDWQSDFVQAYAIDGIPRFIVIDPEGNILNPNAPRPSDPAIRILFESLTTNS